MALTAFLDTAFNVDMKMIADIAEDHLVTLYYPDSIAGSVVTFNAASVYTYTSATWNANQQVNITVHRLGRVHVPYEVTSAYTNRVTHGVIFVDIT